MVASPRLGPFFEGYGKNSSGAEVIVNDRSAISPSGNERRARILEEYLEPRPHNNERILDKLVEVLERPAVLVAVDRLQRGGW